MFQVIQYSSSHALNMNKHRADIFANISWQVLVRFVSLFGYVYHIFSMVSKFQRRIKRMTFLIAKGPGATDRLVL